MVIPQSLCAPIVSIYTRHSGTCTHRAKGASHHKCKCRKHLVWHHNGVRFRKAIKTRSLQQAERARRIVESDLERQLLGVASGVAPEPVVARVDTKEWVVRFLKHKSATSQGVQDRYSLELRRLLEYLEQGGQSFPESITSDVMNDYQATWTSDLATQAATAKRLKGFLRYLYDEKQLDRVPRLAPIEKKDEDEAQKQPLSAEEYERLLQTVPVVFSGDKATRVHGLIQFMRNTGLAILDACTIERSRLVQDVDGDRDWRVVVKRKKTGTPVSNVITLEIATEILAVPNGNPDFIFWNKREGIAKSAATTWGTDLRTVFDAAGLQEFSPHNLRHTFSVGMLSDGVPVEDVSKMLGHKSVKTTEMYYSAWVPKRQKNLDAAIKATWK